MSTVTDLQAWRASAFSAYNDLLTGKMVVEVHAHGYVTRYNRADAEKLRAWIDDLDRQIAAAQRGVTPRRGAVGVIF
jgi:hypothetical protein